jgi:phosphatidylcholine synthase
MNPIEPLSPSEALSDAKPPSAPQITTAAFAVHVLTASGAACALLALIAAVRNDWPQMFIWLGIALLIDGVDGTFARRLRVAEVLPRWSGDVLDLVVDILNYVFVPAYAVVASRLVPELIAVPLGILIVITGSLYFADRLMKTSDYYFRGFPAIWNVAVFYLFVLKPGPLAATISIVALALLTFVPFHVVHPMRIAHLREVTLFALVAWGLLAIYAVATNLDPGFWAQGGLSLLAVYFIALGFLRRRHP